MADSTVLDFSKMKVVDLRKELKSRGLSHTGDKSELVARLQSAVAQDDHGDINLDSDEIDSDGVLEEEDDKNQTDLMLDDTAVELALADHPSPSKEPETKPAKTLKRKLTGSDLIKTNDSKSDTKDSCGKKIILNRSASITNTAVTKPETEEKVEVEKTETGKIKINADMDPKARLELRAKRFGLSTQSLSDEQRKEARKLRFGQTTNTVSTNSSITTSDSATLTENMEKLKKRAERFGQSVSKIMTDIENKEKIEKRKEKFGLAN